MNERIETDTALALVPVSELDALTSDYLELLGGEPISGPRARAAGHRGCRAPGHAGEAHGRSEQAVGVPNGLGFGRARGDGNLSYVKLSAEILDSTVWREAGHVRLVWIAMLAMKNEYQEVMASVPGLADRARVTRAECDDALVVLSSPDPDSRSQIEEGRRILPIPGGWFVVNGETYRRRESPDERRERKAAYMREHRATKAAPSSPGSSSSMPAAPSVPSVDHVTDHGRHVDNVDRVVSVDRVTANVDSVTPRSESGPAESEQSREEDPDLVEFALDGGGPPDPADPKARQKATEERAVFEAWRDAHDHPHAKLNGSKRQKIRARLNEGYSVGDLIQAIKNAKLDRHLMGENDRDTVYDGIETLLKNGSMVERLIELPSKRKANGSAAFSTEAHIYDPGH